MGYNEIEENDIMATKNTGITLDDHFQKFIHEQVNSGRYNSATEVVEDGLRMLEEHKLKLKTLQEALIEGEQSGDAGELDFVRIRVEARRQAGIVMHDA